MRLVTKIRLTTTPEEKISLYETLERCSAVCNFISSIVFLSENSNSFDLQKLVYYDVKEDFKLSAQITLLCIQKTSHDYHSQNFTLRHYSKKSAMPFDDRVLSFFPDKKEVSIWTVNGRRRLPFQCGEKQIALLKKRMGQSDLICENNEFFLLVGYEIEEGNITPPRDFLGVDLGIKNLAVDSEKEVFSGDAVEKKRRKFSRKRKSLQQKGSKNAKKALCKLRTKEKNYKRTQNHEIAKKDCVKGQRHPNGYSSGKFERYTKRENG